jgi:hypothetical protein
VRGRVGKNFHDVAVRQGISTFSIRRTLRGLRIGIIVYTRCGMTAFAAVDARRCFTG